MYGTRWFLPATVIFINIAAVCGQQKTPTAVVSPSSSSSTAVAVTVNGQPITENAVRRALRRVPTDEHEKARPAILQLLIDNALLDQYLEQNGVAIDRKQVEAKMRQVRDELKKNDKTFEQMLRELITTEAEFCSAIEAQLRWDQYTEKQATDENLLKVFNAEREMFDGSLVRARHILLTPAANDPKAAENDKADLLKFKKEIEEKVSKELAKLPAESDKQARDIARHKFTDEVFSDYARKCSACPSKERGGDVDWFPRGGHMVESFAKAAFALKPYQMSEIVESPFGFHLILATDRREGQETKFEEVKAEVKELYCAQLRERICATMRPTAKIAVSESSKP
jgi:parvulin-like peptidyl-prolyl isomerase